MKKLIFIFFLIASLSSYAQFYIELGSGYAFSTKKSTTTFYHFQVVDHSLNEFAKIGNIFTGIFYNGTVGYTFKSNIGIELNGEFNPKPTDILNNPKSIISKQLGNFGFAPYFYDGSYLSAIPRITYQYKIKNFNFLLGFGIGYNLLNYYSYYQTFNKYSTISNDQLVYSYSKSGEALYKYVEEQYRMNIKFKINYAISNTVNMFLEANTNFKFYIIHSVVSKIIYKKEHTEIFDINSNPNTTIIDINEENVKLSHQINYPENFLDISVYNVSSDLSKLIYAQIGLRYTFGKKEKKE